MNKIAYCLLLFWMIFSANSFLSAQNFDLKYYSDYKNDYEGVAAAVYLGNLMPEQNIENFFDSMRDKDREIDKLSKTNYWLCWQALNQWEIEDGETYLIVCAASTVSEEWIVIVVTLEEGGQSFAWRGQVLSVKDFQNWQKSVQ